MGALVKRGVDGGIARVNSANMTCRCSVNKSLLTKLDSIAVSIFVDVLVESIKHLLTKHVLILNPVSKRTENSLLLCSRKT